MLRWLWYEWKEPCKLWVGLGNPCDKVDSDLFYASTTIIISNGAHAPFWDSPWLNGKKPKDIVPLIYTVCLHKNWKVKAALVDDAWVHMIKLDEITSMKHLREFITLWSGIVGTLLDEDIEDDVTCKHSPSGQYSSTSAYKAQFIGSTCTTLHSTIWGAWVPPKAKFFA